MVSERTISPACSLRLFLIPHSKTALFSGAKSFSKAGRENSTPDPPWANLAWKGPTGLPKYCGTRGEK